MNFKKIIPLAACAAFLVSCNYNSTLWNQTFEYKDDIYYNIDTILQDDTKSYATIIDEQIKADNINWDLSGQAISKEGSFTEVKEKFSKSNNVTELKNNMKKIGVEAFKPLKDLKIEISSKDDAKATVTYSNQKKEYVAKPYNDSNSYVQFFQKSDLETPIGYVSAISENVIPGSGWKNGKIPCVEVKYEFGENIIYFQVAFKKSIPELKGTEQGLIWSVYAKIAN